MAVLCQLCCWTGFNDNFLHIPRKTPLQMGCRSRNSIWELGCRSGAARSWQSGSLTWQDCSWDPRGWAAGSSGKPLWPTPWICWMEFGAGWTWGRLVLLSGGSRNLILFASSLQSLDTRFALTPAKAACRHPRQLWPSQQWFLKHSMESVLSKEPLAVGYTPENSLIIWITRNFGKNKVISMTRSENCFCSQVSGVFRMVWDVLVLMKKSLTQGEFNLKILFTSWQMFAGFLYILFNSKTCLDTSPWIKSFNQKLSFLFFWCFTFFKCQEYLGNFLFPVDSFSGDLYLWCSYGVNDFTGHVAPWVHTLNSQLLWFVS